MTISVEKIGERYIARCTYEQKDLVSFAGFRWDAAARQWWTPSAKIAAKLDDIEALQDLIDNPKGRSVSHAGHPKASPEADRLAAGIIAREPLRYPGVMQEWAQMVLAVTTKQA